MIYLDRDLSKFDPLVRRGSYVPTIWRLHLRPDRLDPKDVVSYCANKDVLGLGWRLGPPEGWRLGPPEAEKESVDVYLERHKVAYEGKSISPVRMILKEVAKDDFIWTRDDLGRYILGKVLAPGDFHYDSTVELSASGSADSTWYKLKDMFHFVPVKLIGCGSGEPLSDTEVPGGVKARFAAKGGTLSRIRDDFILPYTTWLFDQKCGVLTARPTSPRFILALSSFELEDLVLLYLQTLGWRIILSSHARNTPRYECTLVRSENSLARTAGVQVRHDNVVLDAEVYRDDKQGDIVYLFAASGNYGNDRPENVRIIKENDLMEFAETNRCLLPKPISIWLGPSNNSGLQ